MFILPVPGAKRRKEDRQCICVLYHTSTLRSRNIKRNAPVNLKKLAALQKQPTCPDIEL